MKPETPAQQADQFLREAGQFRLGKLTTETPHPRTAQLSQTVKESTPDGLALLLGVDHDVLLTYQNWVLEGTADRISDEVVESLMNGGQLFYSGCGATGRLSIQLTAMWRNFWQKKRAQGLSGTEEWENRTFSVMSGGDFALIKSVEGFEDYQQFGKRQIEQTGIRKGDVMFAITEGGETSFVIGTAWKGLEKGARVFFVYDNPDSILCEDVIRSREIIEEDRIEKINLTTGPMAITGSTRMQATSIQLCVMSTIMEMVLRKLMVRLYPEQENLGEASEVPEFFARGLEAMMDILYTQDIREQTARLIHMEEKVYRNSHRNSYFADLFGIDVLTDTTERSPTFCVPGFRKHGDTQAAESWSFLFLPKETTEEAWEHMLKRPIDAISWDFETVKEMIGEVDAIKQFPYVQNIGRNEVLRFRIGMDGLAERSLGDGDSATCIISEEEKDGLLKPGGFFRTRLEEAHANGASTGLVFLGSIDTLEEVRQFLSTWNVPCISVLVPVPQMPFLLNGLHHIGVKMLLNALSTITMVRMGRVMGNVMIWVVPSNLKLIDRATRYIQTLTDLSYDESCHLLFEAIEYVEPRVKAGKAYPSTVGLSVNRARYKCSFEEAEKRLYEDLQA